MANRNINFQVGYTVDKAGLSDIQNALQQVLNEVQQMSISDSLTSELQAAGTAAQRLSTILNESWNSKLNQLDLTKLNSSINNTYGSVSNLKTIFEQSGSTGAAAYNKLASSILGTNLQIKESNQLLNNMATTFANTIKWNAASSAVNSLSSSISSAWSYAQKLDTSLNDIRIVTEKSAEDMAAFAESANAAAKSLGASTTDYTNASLIYYQQGLSDEEVQARTDITLKTANVTGQTASDVSEELTAVWNGYNTSAEEAELYVDRLAAVAASTASDLEELATGMSKVASAANAMGVGEEQLAAQLSTIISVTRQDASSVGTALKTIYARMSDIEAGVDEDGVSLGTYTGEMAEMGVNVLTATGELRDMGEVIEEIGNKWSDYTREQQVALAQTMAGTRQYNNLIALFDNWDDYLAALDTASDAEGTLQEQQDIYMESTAAHLEQLQTAWEGVYNSLLDTDTINNIIDGLTNAVGVLNNFIDSLGGGTSAFLLLGTTAVNVFSNQIGSAIEKQIANMQILKQNQEALQLVSDTANLGISSTDSARETAAYEGQVERARELLNLIGSISSEEYNRLTNLNSEITTLDLALAKWEDLGDKQLVTAQVESELQSANGILTEQNALYQNIANTKQSILQYDQEESTSRQATLDYIQTQTSLEEYVNQLKQSALLTDQQEQILESTYNNLLSGHISTEEALNIILDTQNSALQQATTQREQAARVAKLLAEYDQTDLNVLKSQSQTLKNLYKYGGKDENGNNTLGIVNHTQQQAISDTTKGLSALVISINAVNNAVTVLNDNSLSGWEKFQKIASNLIFTLPMLVSSFSSLQNLLPSIATLLGATAAETATLATTLSFLSTYLAPVLAIAAAVGLAVVAVQSSIASYNEAATAAQKAADAADALADSNQKVADSLENLQSELDTYESALETLSECTKGTEEWKDALEDTNSAAISLLDSLSNLSASDIEELYSRNDDGTLILDSDKLEELVDAYELLANSSELASEYGEYAAELKSAAADLLTATRSASLSSTDRYSDMGDDNSETLAQSWERILEENADVLTGLTREEFVDKVEALGISLEGLNENQIANLQAATEELATQTNDAAANLKLIAELEVSNVLGDSDYESAALEMAATQLTTLTEEYTNAWDNYIRNGIGSTELNLSDATIDKWSGKTNEVYQNILGALQSAGYDYLAGSKNVVQGNSENRNFVFTDENGEDIELSAEWISATLGAYEAMTQLSANAEGAAAALQSLETNAGEDLAEGIKDYISTGSLESLNWSDLQDISQGVLIDGGFAEYLQEIFDATDEELQEFLGENYADDFAQAFSDTQIAMNSIVDDLLSTVQDAFNNLDTTELSVSSQKAIAEALENSFLYGGQEAMDTLSSTFDALDSSNIEGFTDVFREIEDWSLISVQDLIDALDDADVETDLTTEQLYNFIQAMQQTSKTVADTVDSLQETYASIHDIIDDLEQGDTISADDYTSIIEETGSAAGKYFTQMLDGTYKLTGDAEDFYELVQSQLIDSFTSTRDSNSDKISSLGEIKDYDFDQLSQVQSLDNQDAIQQQITLLKELSDVEADTIAKWEELTNSSEETFKVENGEVVASTSQALEEMASEVANCSDAYDNLDESIIELYNENLAIELAIAESCTSLDELQQALNDGTISVEAFNEAYSDLWDAERIADLDTDELKDYADYIQDIADESDEFADSLAEDEDAAEDLAAQIMNMNDAVEDLADNWDDWADVLKNSTKESKEYADAISGARDAMSKLLDIDDEFISDDVILDNMDDIALAAQGDADAIDRLRAATLDDIILNLSLDDQDLYDTLTSDVANLQSMLDAADLSVGATLDDSSFIEAANEMIDTAGLTRDQVNALFGAMGYNVTFEEGTDTVTSQIPVTTKHHSVTNLVVDEETGAASWDEVETSSTTYQDADTVVGSAAMSTEAADGTSSGGDVSYSSGSSHIASVTKKATGSSNNYSSSNAGGNSSGSGSGSGGSGSGSSSTSEPDVMDDLESVIDRYHDINIVLTQIATELNRLQKAQDKYFGQALIDNLNEQLSTLDEQAEAYAKKLAIAQDEAEELQAELAKQGVTFDEDGSISNYEAILAQKEAKLQKMINKYNKMSADEQEAYKETLEKAQEDYDDFVQLISDYDTLFSETIPGLEDSIQDILDEEIQIKIEEFTMEVEIRLDMREAEEDWNEFYRKVIQGIDDDDLLGNAKQNLADFESYFNTANSGTGTIQTLTTQLNNTLTQLKQIDETGTSDWYGDDYTQALEDLQTYYEELATELEDIEDLIDDTWEDYYDLIDEATDAFDDHLDRYEALGDILEHDIDLVQLLYGDDAYEALDSYYAQAEQNYNSQLAFLQQRAAYAYQMMQTETDDEARAKWEEEWLDSISELNDTVEDAAQNIIDKYTNTINQIIDELNDSLTSGLGLDYVSEEWDLINQKADIYLDSINAMYEVQSLQQKYLDAIDATDSISAQQKLNELMEEQISYLEEKGELTEYDIERAELEYEIALKQIALEEAQNNSSTMRLRRDSQGNYTYQYTTDEDAIADAQSELLALQNQLYNLDVEAYNNNLDEIYSAYSEFQQKLLELYEDQTLSEEERAAQAALLEEYYGDIINSLVEENSVIRTNLNDSAFSALAAMYATDQDLFAAMSGVNIDEYNAFVAAMLSGDSDALSDFSNMTEEELAAFSAFTSSATGNYATMYETMKAYLESLDEDTQNTMINSLVPTWTSGVQNMVDTIAGSGGLSEVCGTAYDELEQAVENYEAEMDEMAEAAGVDLTSVANGYDSVTDEVKELIEANEDVIDVYKDEIEQMKTLISNLETMKTAYQDAMNAAKEAAETAYTYIQKVNTAAAEAAALTTTTTKTTTTTTKATTTTTKKSTTTTKKSTTTTKSNASKAEGVAAAIWIDGSTAGWGNGDTRKSRLSAKGVSAAQDYLNNSTYTTGGKLYKDWYNKKRTSYYYGAFDTGGYTGDWNKSEGVDEKGGKLAILHQKELVLNAKDTENILNAVSVVSDISTMLDNLDSSMLNNVTSLLDSLGQFKFDFNKDSDTLEQSVSIEATFPNVTNSTEVEDALNNLINAAAQHANKKGI